MDPALYSRRRALADQTAGLALFEDAAPFELPTADDPIVFEQLVWLMRRLAVRRGERGVTVARTVRAAELLRLVRRAEPDPENPRAGAWRGRLGKAAGLEPTLICERVPAAWNARANANRHTVWRFPASSAASR